MRIGTIPSAGITPFKVTISKTNGANQATINYNSSLMIGPKPTDYLAISGLDVAFFLIGADFIWLEITITSPNGATAATIKSYGLGGGWTPGSDPSAGNGYFEYTSTTDGSGNTIYTQTLARIAIAQIQFGTNGELIVNQMLFNHVRMMATVEYLGIPILEPLPIGVGRYI